MIARDAVPIAHTPPLKRVDIGARPSVQPDGRCVVCGSCGVEQFCPREICPAKRLQANQAEHDRIWGLVRQTAEGTNPPADVCTDGWESA